MDSPSPIFLPPRLRWSCQTNRGKVRQNNEDAFLAMQFDAEEVRYLGRSGEDSTERADFVFAVSDGMGGAKAGELASRVTVDQMTKCLPKAFKQSALGLNAGVDDVLAELFEQIHRQLLLLSASYEECAGMGATLTIGWFTPQFLYFAHIGDSRLYYLSANEGGMRQITEDDTHVGWLFRQGQINEREARSHPRRTVLQKALGAGHQFIQPQVGAVTYEKGDLFLLASDGLIDGLFDEQILQRLRSPDATEIILPPADRLLAASLERSGRDNSTALVIEVF